MRNYRRQQGGTKPMKLSYDWKKLNSPVSSITTEIPEIEKNFMEVTTILGIRNQEYASLLKLGKNPGVQ